MKIVVISDTHGYINDAVSAIKKEKPDYCIHLGDVVQDCEDLESIFPYQKFIFVKGNNDFWIKDGRFPYERCFNLEGKRFFVCHGHKFNVKSDLCLLKVKARENNADIVLYGHTHIKHLEDDGKMLIMNPGASLSYGLITIADGKVDASIKEI